MFGKRSSFLFMSLVALSTAIDPDNICALLGNNAKIVDSNSNCTGYYTCKDGKATAATCPSEYYFNKDTQSCVTKAQATCVTSDGEPCAGVADGKFVAMAGSCSGFYYCKNQVASAGECPNNLNFNPTLQSCQYSNEYKCTIAGGGGAVSDVANDDPTVLCAYVQDGIFFGNAASCTTWHKCKSNVLTSGSCAGFVFNVQTQSCVYESTYTCQQLNGDPTQTGGTPLGPCTEETVVVTKSKKAKEGQLALACTIDDMSGCAPGAVCTEDDMSGCDTPICNTDDKSGCAPGVEPVCNTDDTSGCPPGAVCTVDDTSGCSSSPADSENTQPKKVKDADSCNSYLTCVNKKYVRTRCPVGQYFSLTDQKCTSRQDAVNKCDRCQGSSETFVNAYNDNCHGYFYCVNGKKVGSGTCTNDYYFNEKTGSCGSTTIVYPACLTSSYGDAYTTLAKEFAS